MTHKILLFLAAKLVQNGRMFCKGGSFPDIAETPSREVFEQWCITVIIRAREFLPEFVKLPWGLSSFSHKCICPMCVLHSATSVSVQCVYFVHPQIIKCICPLCVLHSATSVSVHCVYFIQPQVYPYIVCTYSATSVCPLCVLHSATSVSIPFYVLHSATSVSVHCVYFIQPQVYPSILCTYSARSVSIHSVYFVQPQVYLYIVCTYSAASVSIHCVYFIQPQVYPSMLCTSFSHKCIRPLCVLHSATSDSIHSVYLFSHKCIRPLCVLHSATSVSVHCVYFIQPQVYPSILCTSFSHKCIQQSLEKCSRCPKCNYVIDRPDQIYPNFTCESSHHTLLTLT